MKQELEECPYCGYMVPRMNESPDDDEEAWWKDADEHRLDCEWVLTHAHKTGKGKLC